MKQIVMSADGEQTRIAILEDRRLAEFYVDAKHNEQLVGNIYLAKVVNVLPAMQAAFVDIGTDKNAFLYIDDALPANWKRDERGKEKPNIRTLVQVGEEKFVQVNKEAQGTKAPRVTTEISLPGRMLVYLPFAGQVSISRKIQKEAERQRLLTAAQSLLTANEGVIVRTQAEGAKTSELEREWAYLRSLWQHSLKNRRGKTPLLLHQDNELAMRIVRDLFSEDLEECIIDSLELFQKVKEKAAIFQPALLPRLKFYQGKQPVFDVYGVEAEIAKALQRQVPIRNGGFLVIDHTEAMTVIDVNTGKFTGRGTQNLEETVTQMNLEAAKEIAKQLRLRDVGGIIIIDFIDMRMNQNKERVVEALKKELAKDKTTTYVAGMTQLGLVELTRKKVRQNLLDTLTRPCPVCNGSGKVFSAEETLRSLQREVKALARTNDAEAVIVELHSDVYRLLSADENKTNVEQYTQVSLYALESTALKPQEFRILFCGSASAAKERMEQSFSTFA